MVESTNISRNNSSGQGNFTFIQENDGARIQIQERIEKGTEISFADERQRLTSICGITKKGAT